MLRMASELAPTPHALTATAQGDAHLGSQSRRRKPAQGRYRKPPPFRRTPTLALVQG